MCAVKRSQSASDAGVFLWMTYQTMQRMGLDAAAIFASVHLPDEPPDRTVRRDNSTQARFWRAAEAISQDPDVGLHVAEQMPPFRGQVVEYLMLSSPTFGTGLVRMAQYQALMTDALQCTLRVEGETAILSGFSHPVRHYLELAVSIFLGFLRHITDGALTPTEIWLTHPQGATPDLYQQVYGCPVRLGMAEGAICFPAVLLDRPSAAAEPELLRVHESIAKQQLHLLGKQQLIHDIERLLASGLLESGQIDQALIAERLGKTARTLRADLQQIDISFDKIVANYRLRLAKRLLARTSESLDQIVYLTGFSEPSAFSRAFKRWTGETPTDYRKRKHAANNPANTTASPDATDPSGTTHD